MKRKHVDEAKKCFGDLEVGKKQTVMSMYSRKCPPSHATKITTLIAELVARDLRPLSIVEDDGFRQLWNYVEPKYQVPSQLHVRSVCQKLYHSERERLMTKLQAKHVALTNDLWISLAVQAYLTVTAHFINEDWMIESYVLMTKEMPERHTGLSPCS